MYAHNIETVRRLQRYVRDNRAGYDQSLSVLERAKVAGKKAGVYTKTSLMLGLGETEEEIVEVRFLWMLVLRSSRQVVLLLLFRCGWCRCLCPSPVSIFFYFAVFSLSMIVTTTQISLHPAHYL